MTNKERFKFIYYSGVHDGIAEQGSDENFERAFNAVLKSDEDLIIEFGNWLMNNKDSYKLKFKAFDNCYMMLPMKDILQTFKKEIQ